MFEIAENFKAVRARIAARAELIAVSKTQPPEMLEAALAVGQRIFGENRVQEAGLHWADRRPVYPDLELHLIGPLQTNKTREAVALFDVIQTLDRPGLAASLKKEEEKQSRRLKYFIQVNTGAEPQKAGVAVGGLPGLLEVARGLNVAGLMCIPPVSDDPEPHFRLMAQLAAQHGLGELSMGMSHDFETAIHCGATCVRVGTALFGARAGQEL